MDDDLEAVRLAVRADGTAFARDVVAMRDTLEGTLGDGAAAAGRGIEAALARAARSGKFEFEDLAKVAARALADIAASALKVDIGGASAGSGALSGVVSGLLGLPGRATGGPVGPGSAYLVGERGPEVFVPTSSGRVEAMDVRRGAAAVNVTVNVAAPRDAGPEFMARTGRQVAQSVRRALARAGG